MTNAVLREKLDAGNPHVGFDEGEVALAATPRRGSLLYRPGISPCTMRDRQSLSLFLAAVVGTAVALQAIADPGSPGMVVYDGGKALRQNITSGSPVGVNGETYTDENGGKWQYLRANDKLATQTQAFGKSVSSGIYQGIGGNSSRSGSPLIHVNTTGAATRDGVTDGTTAFAEPIDADEFYVHPGNPSAGYHFVVVRFTVPEDGWYSAFLTAHDVNGGGALDEYAGAEIRLLVNNAYYMKGVVRLENYENGVDANYLTRRFDLQMPVRWMAAGETLDFSVGAYGAHNSDATGLKVFVTKEAEGGFYDAGLAMANNMTNSLLNPFGTDTLGMWHYFSVDTSGARDSGNDQSASPAEFLAWAPGNLTKMAWRLLVPYDRGGVATTKGFRTSSENTLPYICVNHKSIPDGEVASQMLVAHPSSDFVNWPTLRFRPPRSGMYSASIVIRDVANEKKNGSDGVMVYLLASEKPVTNGVVAAENWNATAHFTFGPRLVAANEPIDIVISPNTNYYSDSTCISAIFRREADVYDAGPSLAALDWANATKPAHPFADALGGGATWDIGRSSSVGGSFTTMPYAFKKVSNGTDYFGYGAASDGGLPRVMVATNGVANLVAAGDDSLFKLSPNELLAHPDNSGSKFPVVRAKVPVDGIYHARAYARDISKHDTSVGVQLNLLSLGYVAAAEIVSIDGNTGNPYPREAALDGDRLWLKAGNALDAVLDPRDLHYSDSTGMSVCYAIESETVPSVVNIDITSASDSTGRFSAYTGIGREGWSDWNKWNALRIGEAESAKNIGCFEADGLTKRNATVTIVRDSGAAIATVAGGGASTLLNNYVSSSDTSDTYTFAISNLKKNEPYTLWLYSAKGDATGNAAFTLDGATKGVEETWSLGATKMLTRFDVMSDGNGVITGTFAAADANGGAFNGLTLVGDLPAYVAPGTIIFVR